jgi:ferritin-like metal-binding protein YciE
MATKKAASKKSSKKTAKKKPTAKKTLLGKVKSENPLMELFVNELKDIYWAEKHLTKALPKMAKAAQSEELKAALEEHLEVTEGQIERLEEVFAMIDLKPQGKKCEAMAGLVKEGEEIVSEFKGSPALDAAIISASQKVEHYEIASYGCLRTYARLLGYTEAMELLQATLEEEAETDEKLTDIADAFVNEEAEEAVEI